MRLRDLGEGGLIQRIRAKFPTSPAIVGIGDDAAILDIPPDQSVVCCSDLLAENTHFIRTLHPPESVGYKAVAINVSDVGAMGGTPLYFVISLAAPGSLDIAWIDGFYSGVEKACRKFAVSLVGGDTSSAETIFVDVAMIGSVRRGSGVLRSGAKPGDGIYVTGTLGGSVHGLELLRSGNVDKPAVNRHLYPEPRHQVGAVLSGKAHAMTDVSDGLSTDLSHILTESGVAARIYKGRLPIAEGATIDHALHGGEEYELLIAAPQLPDKISDVPLTRIGEIVASGQHQIVLVDESTESVLGPAGWDHYTEYPR